MQQCLKRPRQYSGKVMVVCTGKLTFVLRVGLLVILDYDPDDESTIVFPLEGCSGQHVTKTVDDGEGLRPGLKSSKVSTGYQCYDGVHAFDWTDLPAQQGTYSR